MLEARSMSVNGGAGGEERRMLRGVVFDMDGTLTIPNLDFKDMYERCGVDMKLDLLSEVAKMPEEERKRAEDVIEEIEEKGRWYVSSHFDISFPDYLSSHYELLFLPNTTSIFCCVRYSSMSVYAKQKCVSQI